MDKIRVVDLVKEYGEKGEGQRALDKVTFQVKQGEFLCIMGKSGCGKSTLLKILGAIDSPTNGKVFIDDKDLFKIKGDNLATLRQRKIGFVFQEFLLVDSLTVEENVVLPLFLKGIKFEKAKELLNQTLENFSIKYIRNSYPNDISGGERQRTAIARATIHEPEIIFADEPTGNLDIENSKIIIEHIAGMNRKGQTILMVTHDPTMASFSDRVLFMQDGKILKSLNRDDKNRNEYTKKIISSMGY